MEYPHWRLFLPLLLVCCDTQVYGLETSCVDKPWPRLELWLPVRLDDTGDGRAFHRKTRTSSRNGELFDFFLRSLLLFWPLQTSRTTLRIVVDEELRGTVLLNRTWTRVREKMELQYPATTTDLTYGPVSPAYHGNGYDRQQWMMFWADNYTSAEYVGFVDTDSVFITYVDRDDLFEDGNRPVINGRIGINERHPWSEVPAATVAFTGLLEPMRCMSYFPVVIKTAHLRGIREIIAQQHNQSFDEVFRNLSSRSFYSQFNIMCTYLFHFHRNEYRWYVHDTHPEGCRFCMDKRWRGIRPPPNRGELANKSVFEPYMFSPKGRVAVHARYHGDLPGGDPNSRANIFNNPTKLDHLLRRGYCESPPLPKSDSFCTPLLQNATHFPEMYNFDYVDYNEVYSVERLRAMYLERRSRLSNCNHSWPLGDKALSLPALKSNHATLFKCNTIVPSQAIAPC